MRRWKACILMIVVLFLVACSDKPIQYQSLGYQANVVAFGDSVTFGYGVAPEYAYPTILAELSNWHVMNLGVSGERADEAKLRIDQVLHEMQPKLVIIELGGNDFLQRRSASAVKEDLRSIIQSVKNYGAIPVLVAVPALTPVAVVTGKPSDASIYQELGQEEKVNVISDVFSDILGQESLKQDMIHPNQQGYRLLAEKIYQQLKGMGL